MIFDSPSGCLPMADSTTRGQRIKAWRRKVVHRLGKKFLRGILEFQGRHSRIAIEPVLDKASFDWVPLLEASWPQIRTEFEQVWAHPEDIPAFHQISPDQTRISKGDHWKTFVLRSL